MRGRLFLAALFAAAAVFAAPAHAGNVTFSGGSTYTFTAGAGEANQLTVTSLPTATLTCISFSPCIRISDAIGITEDTGSCNPVSATAVDCSRVNQTRVILLLGDNNDILQTNGLYNDLLTVDGGPGDDIVNGGNGNDLIGGGSGLDLVLGGAGNDTLEGGPGPDSYFGEAGDDLLRNSYDNDDFNGNAGIDTVDYSGIGASFDPSCLPMTDCPIGVSVTFDGVNNDGSLDLDMAFGTNPGDRVNDDIEVVVGTIHPDTLNGGSGDLPQTFTGLGGNDTIAGGGGMDVLRESALSQSAGVTMTLGNGTLAGFFGSDTFTTIENVDLQGGSGNDTLNASAYTAGPVTLRGGLDANTVGNGNDTLVGGTGNDFLYGGGGTPGPDNDLLTGGPGNDTIQGGATDGSLMNPGTNTLVESGDVSLTLTNTGLSGSLGIDTIANVQRATLTGGAGNNTLNASAFTNGPVTLDGGGGIDLLQGGSGADFLTGGPGADTLDGGPSNADMLVETADANMTLTSASMSGVGADALSNIEQATLNGGDSANVINTSAFGGPVTVNGGAGADTITGGPLADTLNGGDANDTIVGGDAMDILNGDAGADSLNGGLSLDTLHGGEGDDTLDGGADAVNDVIDGDAGENRLVASGDTNFTLTDTNLVGNGNDSFIEITRVTLTGGAGDNALNASSFTLGSVILNGGGGADTLLGSPGPDTLTGGLGVDTFDAGAGADTVQARDSVNESSIVCGTDTDTAVLDKGDVANADCDIKQLPDTTPPNTKLKKSPKATTKSRTAQFRFTSTEPGSKFQCKLDRKAWASCKSPKTYKNLKKGKHTFQVRAIDKAGNRDKTPAKKTWRIT